ncbi:MAG TPA: hypothetical protein VH309_07045 [Elusimicrobiota bacterium]|jgi:hypothetical protein|nr:hypothetical protein [Elusimicrobiota bacterium]
MKRALLCAALIPLGACAAPRMRARSSPGAISKGVPSLPGVASASAAASAGVHPIPPAPPEVKDPNFILVVSESVPNPGDDGISFTKVFVDGKEAGATAVGRKSDDRALKLKLPAGNDLIRLEQWSLPGVGDWNPVEKPLQPRERFVRIEDGTIARLELRFSEGEESNSLTLTRAPAGH